MTKITVYYFGDINNTIYKCKNMTVKKFKNLLAKKDKATQNIAFILQGTHKEIESCKLSDYLNANNLNKIGKWDIK